MFINVLTAVICSLFLVFILLIIKKCLNSTDPRHSAVVTYTHSPHIHIHTELHVNIFPGSPTVRILPPMAPPIKFMIKHINCTCSLYLHNTSIFCYISCCDSIVLLIPPAENMATPLAPQTANPRTATGQWG